MAVAVEGGVEKDLEQFGGLAGAEGAGAEGEDVRVVVGTGHPGREAVARVDRPDAGEAVRRHRHADSGAAHQQAAVGLARGDRSRYRRRLVGVVDGGRTVGAEVDDLDAAGTQNLTQPALQLDPGMVGAERELHAPSSASESRRTRSSAAATLSPIRLR